MLVLAAAAFPAVAFTKGTNNNPRLPDCAKVSRKAMADLAQTGPLKLLKKIATLCDFTGHHKHHYEPTLVVQIIPYFKTVWDIAQGDATKHSGYGRYSKSLFFVSGEKTDAGLTPCAQQDYGKPGAGQSRVGPVCSPEPPMAHIGVYGNGVDKRTGLRLMVSAGVTGQAGDVHLSHIIELVQEIISGKIH